MHSSNSQQGDAPTSIQPFVIARADFEKLYPIYQKIALALVRTGKVLIVDYCQSLTHSATCQPSTATSAPVTSTAPMPPSGGYRICAPSPDHGGMVAQAGAEGVPHGAPLAGDGGSCWTPQRGGHQPASLGYFRLIRNEQRERVGVVQQ